MGLTGNGTNLLRAFGVQLLPRLTGFAVVEGACAVGALNDVGYRPGNVAIANGQAFVATSDGRLSRVSFTSDPYAPLSAGVPVGPPIGVGAIALGRDAGRVVVGGYGPSGSLLVEDLDGGVIAAAGTSSNVTGPPVVGSNGEIFAVFRVTGSSSEVRKYSNFTTPLMPERVFPWAGAFTSVTQGSPLLTNDGLLYLAGANGRLTVLRQADLSLVQEFQLPMSAEHALNLDCNRRRPQSRTGVLYLSGQYSLLSLIVDSTGLDPNAPWPRYQHDSAGTGNYATPIGCPP